VIYLACFVLIVGILLVVGLLVAIGLQGRSFVTENSSLETANQESNAASGLPDTVTITISRTTAENYIVLLMQKISPHEAEVEIFDALWSAIKAAATNVAIPDIPTQEVDKPAENATSVEETK